jgi:AbrB family looped-hinge helix DNA binding protein
MSPSLKVSRVQKKGQVTIPAEIRQKLGLAEGDLVAFIETAEGVVISPQAIVPVAVKKTHDLSTPTLDAADNP